MISEEIINKIKRQFLYLYRLMDDYNDRYDYYCMMDEYFFNEDKNYWKNHKGIDLKIKNTENKIEILRKFTEDNNFNLW